MNFVELLKNKMNEEIERLKDLATDYPINHPPGEMAAQVYAWRMALRLVDELVEKIKKEDEY